MRNPMSYFVKPSQKMNEERQIKKVEKDANDLKKEEQKKHQAAMDKIRTKPSLQHIMPGMAAARMRDVDRIRKEQEEVKKYENRVQEIDKIKSVLIKTIKDNKGNAPVTDVKARFLDWEMTQRPPTEQSKPQPVEAAPTPSQDPLTPEYEAWMAREVATIEAEQQAQPNPTQQVWTADDIARLDAINAYRDAEIAEAEAEAEHGDDGQEISR